MTYWKLPRKERCSSRFNVCGANSGFGSAKKENLNKNTNISRKMRSSNTIRAYSSGKTKTRQSYNIKTGTTLTNIDDCE